MPPQREMDENELVRVFARMANPRKTRTPLKVTGTSTGAGDDDGDMHNPMVDAGSIIIGGVDGAPKELKIGSTGYVLQVVAGKPAWVINTSGSALTVKEGVTTRDTAVTTLVFPDTQFSVADSPAHTETITLRDEYIDDRVSSLVIDSTSIDVTYNDGSNTLSFAVIDEYIEDLISSFFIATSSTDVTYNDGSNTIAINVKDEYIEDLMSTFLVASTGISIVYADGSDTLTFSVSTNLRTFTANFLIDGGGSTITTGIKGYFIIDRAAAITAVTLASSVSGSITITIKKATYTNFPTLTSIVAAALPTLSSAQKSRDTTLTGWTTAVVAGDVFEVSVTSVATVSQVLMALTMVAT